MAPFEATKKATPAGYLPRFTMTRLQRSRSSWGVYVPRAMVRELGLERGSALAVYVVDGVICVQPIFEEGFIPRIRAAAPAGAMSGRTDAY